MINTKKTEIENQKTQLKQVNNNAAEIGNSEKPSAKNSLLVPSEVNNGKSIKARHSEGNYLRIYVDPDTGSQAPLYSYNLDFFKQDDSASNNPLSINELEDGSIRELDCSKCNLNQEFNFTRLEDILESNKHMKKLTFNLCLSIKDDEVKKIGKLSPELESISLEGCPITVSCILDLGRQCKKLKNIKVIGCHAITGEDIKYINKKYPHITMVS